MSLWSWFDLPDDPRSRELSGIAWDEASRTLWAVQDDSTELVAIAADRDLRTWSLGGTVRVQTTDKLDLEGIVIVPDGFVLASEIGPRLVEIDRAGKVRRDIPIPQKLGEARPNKSLESLGATSDGSILFTMTEDSLPRDGPPPSGAAGTKLRLIRIVRATGAATEYEYLTDSAEKGDYGVSDLVALADDDLLVLERGWAKGRGNVARLYRVNLAESGAECSTVDRLDDTMRPLAKELFVDIATLPTDGVPAPRQIQATALLDNYEGLTLGPVLPDGRRSLILVSDDNGRSDQDARILVLALG